MHLPAMFLYCMAALAASPITTIINPASLRFRTSAEEELISLSGTLFRY